MPFLHGFPAISYSGGKGFMAHELVQLMPKSGDLMIDVFAGRGNVTWAAMCLVDNFDRYWVNDKQTGLWYRDLKTHGARVRVPQDPNEIMREYNRILVKKNKVGYENLTPEERLLEPHLTRGGGGYGHGGPASTGNCSPELFEEKLRECARLVRKYGPKITCDDWQDLPLSTLGPNDFMYLDPPYFGASVRCYKPWTYAESMRLVEFLKHARCKWMFSEYWQPFYVRAFGKPTYEKHTTCKVDNSGGKRVECVWTNY